MCAKRAPSSSTPDCDSGSLPTDSNQQTSRNHSDVSSNIDEFEDNGETSESSDVESTLTASIDCGRWIPQPRSRSGFLAYVIFTGRNTGVFYNWNATSSARMEDDEVIYKGFPSIEEAHAAWDIYRVRNILPPGLAARGSRTPTSSYRGSPSRQVAENSPQRIPLGLAGVAPVLTNDFAVRSRNFGSAFSTNFYTVLTGLAPGVYNSRITAEMALGPLAVATFERTGTREEANEIFVARYMAGAVARFV